MRIERFSGGKLSPDGQQAVVLESLEEFPDIFPELRGMLEQRLAGTPQAVSLSTHFASDALFAIGDPDHRRCPMPHFSIPFSIGTSPIAEDMPFGDIHIAYDPAHTQLLVNTEDICPTYDLVIDFGYAQRTPIHRHGYGWKHHTSHSQFGTLYGMTGESANFSDDYVRFLSTKHRKALLAHHESGDGELGAESEDPAPRQLPLEMQLLVAVNWEEMERELPGGESSGQVKYWGIKLHAADLNWGDGEFVSLVRHLGLGRGEKPVYTFERYDPPQR